MKSGIYKITNKINGKFYIGSSHDIEDRWIIHVRNLNAGTHVNPKFQHAWNKYGSNVFMFEILEEVENQTQKLLFERENHYLSTLKPFERNVGYNICPKAEGGDTITHNPNRDAFIEKMKIVTTGEGNGMFGKKHDDQAIQLQKDKSVGRYTLGWFVIKYGHIEGTKKFDDRRLMLKNRKMNYSYDNKLTGIKRGPMSDEVKQRISDCKAKMKTIRQDLINDLLLDKCTIPHLVEKYGVSKNTILAQKRKLK